jgi:hypothetical protein
MKEMYFPDLNQKDKDILRFKQQFEERFQNVCNCDIDELLTMISVIGKNALNRINPFLKSICDEIIKVLSDKCEYSPVSKRNSSLGCEIKIWPKGTENKNRWYVGSCIDKYNGKLALISWIWAKGGCSAEDKLVKLLPSKDIKRSKEFIGWQRGSIAFNHIEIKIDDVGTDIDDKQYIKHINKAFSMFSEDLLKKIFKSERKW